MESWLIKTISLETKSLGLNSVLPLTSLVIWASRSLSLSFLIFKMELIILSS